MKALLVFTFCQFFSLMASAIDTRELSFQFVSNDGTIALNCVHSQIRDLPDWQVVCGKGTPLEKRYTVHFLTNQYFKPTQPVMLLEYLYWVTDWNSVNPIYTATSFWMKFKEKTNVQSIRLNQGIENDYADLVLDYSP